jgi:hypothetical protein
MKLVISCIVVFCRHVVCCIMIFKI